MANYGFDSNEVIQTKVTLIDKDGFHKESDEVPSGGNDESSNDSVKEPIEFYLGDSDDAVVPMLLIINGRAAYKAGMSPDFYIGNNDYKIKYYFGDDEPTYENMIEFLFEDPSMSPPRYYTYYHEFNDDDPEDYLMTDSDYKQVLMFDGHNPPSATTHATVVIYDVSSGSPVEWGRKTSRWT